MTHNDPAPDAGGNVDKIWSVEFVKLFLVGFLFNTSMFMQNSLMSVYADSFRISAAEVGGVVSIFAISALAIRPVAGPAMDYVRKERLLGLSLALLVIAYLGYGFSGSIGMASAARVLHGAAFGVAMPLTMVMASHVLPESKMASGIGIYSMTQALSTAIGPSLGLWSVDKIGFNNTFFALAGVLLIAAIGTLSFKPDRSIRSADFRIALNRIFVPSLFFPVLVSILGATAFASINSFVILYGRSRGVESMGLYFTANAVALVLSRIVIGKIADKYGIDKAMIPGLLFFILTFVLMASAKTLPMFILTGFVAAFGFGGISPLLTAMCMQLVPKTLRGAASNSHAIGMDLGIFLGGILSGILITGFQNVTGSEVGGYSAMYLSMIIPVVLALTVFLLIRKNLLRDIEKNRIESMAGA